MGECQPTCTGTRLVLGVAGTGVSSLYLAKLKQDAVATIPHVDQLSGPGTKAKVETIAEFRAKYSEEVSARLLNKVKKCPCGKACAFTLAICNSCGASLQDVALSYTDNVFMGFIYGIGKGNFPYTISLRAETEDFLCFDDPLALSVVHLNAIPTSLYIPDCRYLFADPKRGLEVLDKLFETAAEAALKSYWSDEVFRNKFFAGESPPTLEQIRDDIALCGMNYPPSVYQLHLQFIHPPILPFHYAQARDENHFHHGRFFPLEYLRAALEKGDDARISITETTDIQEIIQKMNGLGVNYDEFQIRLLRRARRLQERFKPWKEEDFECVVVNGKVFSLQGFREEALDAKVLHAEDTKALQNYGRPYDKESQKPTGQYYRYAKEPSEVKSFVS